MVFSTFNDHQFSFVISYTSNALSGGYGARAEVPFRIKRCSRLYLKINRTLKIPNLVPRAFPLKKWVGREKVISWIIYGHIQAQYGSCSARSGVWAPVSHNHQKNELYRVERFHSRGQHRCEFFHLNKEKAFA